MKVAFCQGHTPRLMSARIARLAGTATDYQVYNGQITRMKSVTYTWPNTSSCARILTVYWSFLHELFRKHHHVRACVVRVVSKMQVRGIYNPIMFAAHVK